MSRKYRGRRKMALDKKNKNTFEPPEPPKGHQQQNQEEIVGDIENEFNIVLLGDRNVGKTSLLFKSATNMYSDVYLQTEAVDFRRIYVKTHDGKQVAMKLWDTPGCVLADEQLTKDLYCFASAFLVVYDVTNIQSYNNVYDWMKIIKKYSLDKSQVIVFGNKTDLTNQRELSKEDGIQLAASYGAKFMETNVPHKRNIQKTLKRLATNLCNAA